MFENMVMRRIYGSKRDKMVGSWRKLRNVKLHDLYSSRNVIIIVKTRRMKWAYSTHGKGEECM
jgi:hypothetical protein